MADARGRGMSAFFTPQPKRPPRPATPRRVRTTISLPPEDADWLEMLRMRLRRRLGRGLTYGDVIAAAIRRLAQDEGLVTDAS